MLAYIQARFGFGEALKQAPLIHTSLPDMDRSTDVLPAAVSTVSATSPYSSSAHDEHACQCSLSGGLHRLFAGRAEASADMRLYTKLFGIGETCMHT